MPAIEIGKQKPFIVLTALHVFAACLVLANELLAINNRVPGGNFPIEHRFSWVRVLLFCSIAVISVIVVWIFRDREDLAAFLPSLKLVLPVAIFATLISVLSNYASVTGWCCDVYPTRYFGFPFSYLRGDSLLEEVSLIFKAGTLVRYRLYVPYQFFLDLLFWSNVSFLVFSLVPFLIQKGKAARGARKDVRVERPLPLDRVIRLFLAIFFGIVAGLIAFLFPARPLETPDPMAISSLTTSAPTPTLISASSERIFMLVSQNSPVPKLSSTSTPPPATVAEGTCPGAPPVGASTGQIAMLRLDPSLPGRVQEQPDLESTVLGELQTDEFFIILDGPQCAGGLIWWKIQSARGLLGWIAEGYVSSYWLVTPTPIDTNPTETITPSAAVSTPTPSASPGAELLRILTGHTGAAISLAWSADGTRLASGNAEHIRIWNWAQDQHHVVPLSGQNLSSITWSPDGERVASEESGQVLNSSNGELLVRMDTPDTWNCKQLRWSPNGLLLAGVCTHGRIFIWDASTGELLRTLQSHVESVSDMDWSPNGQYIASGSYDATLRIFDVISGEQTTMFTNKSTSCRSTVTPGSSACPITSIAWSPDGSQIAYGSNDFVVETWDFSKQVIRLVGHYTSHDDANSGYIAAVAWSPDGKRLASTSGDGKTIRVWDVAREQPPYVLDPEDIYSAGTIAWSPDGKYLAVAGSSKHNDQYQIWIWSIP